MKRRFISEGHIIDSGIFAGILNLIAQEGAGYDIVSFEVGRTHVNTSRLEIDLICDTPEQLNNLTKKLVQQGCYEKSAGEALLKPAEKDACAPEDFYSTTNHRTEVYMNREWHPVSDQRMDGVIVYSGEGKFFCKKLRNLKKGDPVVCNPDSVRVFPPPRDRKADVFGFMSGDVSSERSVQVAVEKIAEEMSVMKKEGKKIVAVAGPVVVHTGGGPALASLIRQGYIQGLLTGNAVAVHDIESVFFGTSLGIDLQTGRPSHEGHKNHMRAINRVNRYGSIAGCVEAGVLDRGIMYELTVHRVPYCLAGSIRDDGPLPETETDMIRAQDAYASIIKEADMVLMLSTMLHSIGTGNMLPSWVKTICIDINPAVVTKLLDRGSGQAIGLVSDVGLFLNMLEARLSEKMR